jgi:hypothetical protein
MTTSESSELEPDDESPGSYTPSEGNEPIEVSHATDAFDYLPPIGRDRVLLAYEAGRLTNHLRYELVRTQFTYNDPEYTRGAKRSVKELVRRVRTLLHDMMSRDEFEALIKARTRDFLCQYYHPYNDPIGQFLEEYADPQRFSPHEILDIEGERRSICDAFVRSISNAIQEIDGLIWGHLDERQRIAFGLGRHVDRGIRRLGIQRRMLEEDLDGKFSIKRRFPGDRPLTEDWSDRLTDFLRENGLPYAEIGEIVHAESIHNHDAGSLTTAIELIVRRILVEWAEPDAAGVTFLADSGSSLKAHRTSVEETARPEDELGKDQLAIATNQGDSITTPPLTCDPTLSVNMSADECTAGMGKFGLKFNQHRQTLGREGDYKTVEFKGKRVIWALMNALAEAGEFGLTRNKFDHLWASVDRDSPSDSSIYGAISNLRSVIRPLELDVSRKNGDCNYRLTELTESSVKRKNSKPKANASSKSSRSGTRRTRSK